MIDKLSKNRFKNKYNNNDNKCLPNDVCIVIMCNKIKSNKSNIQSKVNNNTICV